MNKVSFFADWSKPEIIPSRPLKILFLTSVRDTGICDLNGSTIQHRDGRGYMMGTIERTIQATLPGQPLYGLIQVVGVINDDLPKDMVQAGYPLVPTRGVPWIYPLGLRDHDGSRIIDMTWNIGSLFRSLPLHATGDRMQLKLKFERAVLQKMQELGAGILVSDHFMARFEHFCNGFGMFGRVLNIHPAVTLAGHPFSFRGKTPTADAIARAKSESGVVTGATLHLINDRIDDGPPIAYAVGTPVYSDDEPQWLRYRNYKSAKLPLFVAGMRHYVTRIFHHLGTIDLNHMTEEKL